MLGDLIILIDSLSISLGMEIAWVAVGNHSSVVRAPAAKAGGPRFFSSSWLTNVDGMKDLWCSGTARLLSTQI